MYELYGGELTRAILVEMVLREGDLPYKLHSINTSKQEHLSEEFLKLNPAGWVPILTTPEGDVLYETPAINLYLAEKHQLIDLAPGIDDPFRGFFLSALFYITDELEPALKRYWFSDRYGNPETVREKAYEYALHCFNIINQRLEKDGPFHLGDRFSLPDLIAIYWAVSFEKPGILGQFPALKNCADQVVVRPKIAPLFEKLERSMAEFYAWRNKESGDL